MYYETFEKTLTRVRANRKRFSVKCQTAIGKHAERQTKGVTNVSKIDELIKLVQEAVYAAKQPRMDGSGINHALDTLQKIETQKLCVKAHEEEKNLRAMVLMKTKYSEEELDMILSDDADLSEAVEKVVNDVYKREELQANRKRRRRRIVI